MTPACIVTITERARCHVILADELERIERKIAKAKLEAVILEKQRRRLLQAMLEVGYERK